MVDPVFAEATYDKTIDMVRKYQRLWPASEKRALIKALYGEELGGKPARFGDPWFSTGPDSVIDDIIECWEPDLNQNIG